MMVAKPSKEQLVKANKLDKKFIDSIHFKNGPAIVMPIDDNFSASIAMPMPSSATTATP